MLTPKRRSRDFGVRAHAKLAQNRLCRFSGNPGRRNLAGFSDKLGPTVRAVLVPGGLGRAWLCWQSAAKGSLLSDSLICRKIQGISALLAPSCPARAEFSISYQAERAKFPKQRIRELSRRNKEFWNGNRDFTCWSRQVFQGRCQTN